MTELVGIPDIAWLNCFPEAAVEQILEYVTRSWNELVALFPHAHHAGEREPMLTKSLAEYLDDPERRRSAAIGGRFHAERPVNRRRGGKLKQAGRTDIEYHYPAPGSAALTLEFKKLRGTSNCRSAYRNQGMAKFVAGTYAKDQSSGVMCGLATSPLAAEVEAMRASIARCRVRLACIPREDGSVATKGEPLPTGAIRFDTNHVKASSGMALHISHLFMPLNAKHAKL